MNTRRVGEEAEDAAVLYLKSLGYEILCRNYRFRHTEIDIIAKDKTYLVYIEVKYRKDSSRQHPLSAVGPEKQKRICMTALQYMREHRISLSSPCRFDVLALLGEKTILVRDAFPFQYGRGW